MSLTHVMELSSHGGRLNDADISLSVEGLLRDQLKDLRFNDSDSKFCSDSHSRSHSHSSSDDGFGSDLTEIHDSDWDSDDELDLPKLSHESLPPPIREALVARLALQQLRDFPKRDDPQFVHGYDYFRNKTELNAPSVAYSQGTL